MEVGFHRIFDGHDVEVLPFDLVECGVQGCGLAGTRRPRYQDHAEGRLKHFAERLERLGWKAERCQVEGFLGAAEQAQDGHLTPGGIAGRYPEENLVLS